MGVTDRSVRKSPALIIYCCRKIAMQVRLLELQALDDEIVLTKTTDSALTGTNLRLILRNMEISNVVVAGIFTDQCISSTVRSLADESFNVVVVEDCCAAATEALHRHELEIINMIYCHVVSSEELLSFYR